MDNLAAAVRLLASHTDASGGRDDVGFNLFDTDFGVYLSNKPRSEWTAAETIQIFRRLRKYHRQLEEGGIPFVSIQPPPPGCEALWECGHCRRLHRCTWHGDGAEHGSVCSYCTAPHLERCSDCEHLARAKSEALRHCPDYQSRCVSCEAVLKAWEERRGSLEGT